MPVQKWSDTIWVAQLAGDPGWSEDLDDLIRRCGGGGVDLILDLSGVDKINSSHLSRLLRLRKELTDRGRRLRLTSPNDRVWSVFLTTGVDALFEFREDTSTALAELQLGG